MKVTATAAAPRVFSDANRIQVDAGGRLALARLGPLGRRGRPVGHRAALVRRHRPADRRDATTVPLAPAWTRRGLSVTGARQRRQARLSRSAHRLATGATAYLDAVQLERGTATAYNARPDKLAASLQRSGSDDTGLDIVQVGGTGRPSCAARGPARPAAARGPTGCARNTGRTGGGAHRLTARAADQGGATAGATRGTRSSTAAGQQFPMTGDSVGQG